MIAPLIGGWGEKLKDLASRWTAYAALGSFALYLFGYLVLRFHLTTLGIGTDLAVLDERYLFAGAKFLVYLASAFPIALLLVAILAGLFYMPYRVLPEAFRAKVGDFCTRLRGSSEKITIAGIMFSLALIQLVMRQCFFLSNVLLAWEPPRDPRWLIALLQAPYLVPLFFSGMLAGAAIPVVAFVWGAGPSGQQRRASWLRGILGVLIAIQALLLPVNYGVLVADKSLPRVATIEGEPALAADHKAWLVWEGKDGVTYLMHRGKNPRALLTLRRQDTKRIEIVAYDSWMSIVSAGR